MTGTLETDLKTVIREVQDFPIPGVNYKDISPIFMHPHLIEASAHGIASFWLNKGVNKVMGIESRGFLLGPQIARELNAGFVMVRKAGKLPPQTFSMSYTLEYGNATIEVIRESILPGDKVLIHDDLLATGGTASAAAKLVEGLGAEVAGFGFLVNLPFLNGETKLKAFSNEIHSLISYSS